ARPGDDPGVARVVGATPGAGGLTPLLAAGRMPARGVEARRSLPCRRLGAAWLVGGGLITGLPESKGYRKKSGRPAMSGIQRTGAGARLWSGVASLLLSAATWGYTPGDGPEEGPASSGPHAERATAREIADRVGKAYAACKTYRDAGTVFARFNGEVKEWGPKP